MDVKQLRIGNLIKTEDATLSYWEITEEDLIEMLSKEDRSAYLPIEITKDLLIDVGFNSAIENDKTCFYTDDSSCVVWFYNNGKIDIRINGIYFTPKHGEEKYKYFHQLQNLYFAVYGTELPVRI